ncbi:MULTISPECIES: primosomal protein N' [Methylococcus]|uniref:Replication restart protein PriA n=1 Tax=Methylococcus capsulatus (strain ATCC 33009 / NCIMB 11132 / Bath) TaxID=243233 RepID=Q604F0_METCA|nr:primosomal protein N' [Methylococcus capsulatus]AAU91302.1 primosomal protein N` [Methylococcus capsulatus str. Bath]
METVVRVAVPIPAYRCFDYLAPAGVPLESLLPGVRLSVPFGNRIRVGYLIAVVETPGCEVERLRPAAAVLDAAPLLSETDLKLLRWAARYYHHPLGEVIQSAFPVHLREGGGAELARPSGLVLTPAGAALDPATFRRAPVQRRLFEVLRGRERPLPASRLAELAGSGRTVRDAARRLVERGWAEWVDLQDRRIPAVAGPPLQLNPAQLGAVDEISQNLGRYGVFLLEGVTGSGKTEVYIEVIRRVITRGEQALVLVPEISLTPQLERRLRERIEAPLAVFHSGLSETERAAAWLGFQKGEVGVLLGTRSAVFAPMRWPGVIVLDEEHDRSFKQQEGFRFSARDVAVMRARMADIPLVAGSATPSLESIRNVQRGRYVRLVLPARAGAAVAPRYRVLDIRARRLQDGLSEGLIAAMRDTLAAGDQVLLFLNRRGFAPALVCHGCGWVARCRRCDANLVLHARESRLRCHHCAAEHGLPGCCPSCGQEDLRPLGVGTERVDEALRRLFPEVGVARIDRDSTRGRRSLERMLERVQQGEVGILLGTQMLAKGHHFPGVTLVGILDVDAGFYSTDFRAAEHTAQLIVQVAGRAGRGGKPGTVLLQTRHPDHPLLQRLLRDGYPGFAAAELAERESACLPPFGYQALWRAESKELALSMDFLARLREEADGKNGAVHWLGPAPAPMPRQAGRYRAQLWLKSARREELHAVLTDALARLQETPERRVRWSLDVDPVDFY